MRFFGEGIWQALVRRCQTNTDTPDKFGIWLDVGRAMIRLELPGEPPIRKQALGNFALRCQFPCSHLHSKRVGLQG